MSENAAAAVFFVCITVLTILFAGEPDIADSVMVRLISSEVCHD